MNCSKTYLADDSMRDHKKKNPDCRNFGVGILQTTRNSLVLANSTETMVESREGYIPLDENWQPKQAVNVEGVEEGVVPNSSAIVLNWRLNVMYHWRDVYFLDIFVNVDNFTHWEFIFRMILLSKYNSFHYIFMRSLSLCDHFKIDDCPLFCVVNVIEHNHKLKT